MTGTLANLRLLRAEELVEDAGAIRLRDADARVAHANAHGIRSLLGSERNAPPRPVVFDGVRQEVVDGDAEQVLVDVDETELARHLELEGKAGAASAARDIVEGVAQQLGELHALTLQVQAAVL